MRKMITLTAAALSLLATPAHADGLTGNDLLAGCTSEQVGHRIFCLGYVAGISDFGTMFGLARGAAQARAAAPGMYFCRAPGSTNDQLADVVVAYLRAHPAERHLPAMALVVNALRDAFPCNEHPDVAR